MRDSVEVVDLKRERRSVANKEVAEADADKVEVKSRRRRIRKPGYLTEVSGECILDHLLSNINNGIFPLRGT